MSPNFTKGQRVKERRWGKEGGRRKGVMERGNE
jgi:hypothetical protein